LGSLQARRAVGVAAVLIGDIATFVAPHGNGFAFAVFAANKFLAFGVDLFFIISGAAIAMQFERILQELGRNRPVEAAFRRFRRGEMSVVIDVAIDVKKGVRGGKRSLGWNGAVAGAMTTSSR
jgi:hypothetical protein